MSVIEHEALHKLASLESELGRMRGERDQLDEARRQVAEEVNFYIGSIMCTNFKIKYVIIHSFKGFNTKTSSTRFSKQAIHA